MQWMASGDHLIVAFDNTVSGSTVAAPRVVASVHSAATLECVVRLCPRALARLCPQCGCVCGGVCVCGGCVGACPCAAPVGVGVIARCCVCERVACTCRCVCAHCNTTLGRAPSWS